MVFYTSLSCLMIVRALQSGQSLALAAAIPLLAGCAATKLEGVVYAAAWFCVLLPVMWRRGWLKLPVLWRAAGLGMVCLLPYVMFRLAKPVSDSANDWWQGISAAPGVVPGRLWDTWSLNVFNRFFSHEFFHWTTNNEGSLAWAGHWTGLGSLCNPELAVLPWLVLFLLAFFLWKGKGNSRQVVGCLSVAIIAAMTILAFVITGYLSLMSAGETREFNTHMIDFSSDVVGRYYYPLFTAWFLGMVSLSFPGQTLLPPDKTSGKG